MQAGLKHKTVLITGASRGLGAQIAYKFWQQNANLILIARSSDKLELLRDELLLKGSSQQSITIIKTDLADEQAMAVLVEKIKLIERIDILVNNAAIQGPIGPVWENDWKQWQVTLQVNLLAPIALCRAVIPKMIQHQHGKIINLSGGGATSARPHFSAYAVAKAGLVRFSETLAEEVKSHLISVNCIAPGMMQTEMLAEILRVGADRAGKNEYTKAKNQIDTEQSAIQHAAELCVFLAVLPGHHLTGKLISAIWDPWKDLPHYLDDLASSDIYTLRRIVPKDRNKNWGGVT